MIPTSLNKILFLALIIVWSACANTEQTTQKENASSTKSSETLVAFAEDIPPLKQREGKLADAPEWSSIWEEGQNLYQKVRMTGDAKSALLLAAVYMQEARITGDHPYYYNAALDVLNVVGEQPQRDKILNYQALTSKGSVYLSQHQFDKALAIGKDALKIETKDAQVYGVLCDANLELGNYEEAVKMADKMVSIKPDLRSYARISYLRELFGDYEGAVDALELAIAAGIPGHENTAWARHTLANLMLDYGKTAQAKEQLEGCLKERPTYAFAIATLADIALKENNIAEAEKLTDKACALMPEFSFFVTKAKIQKAKGEMAAFDKTRNELLVMMKEDTESGHNMNLETASIYLDLFEDTDKAMAYAEQEYKKRPGNIEVNKLMGEILFESEKYDQAIGYFDIASKTKWSAPDLLCLSGLSLCKKGDMVKGKEKLALALKYEDSLEKELVEQSKKFMTL